MGLWQVIMIITTSVMAGVAAGAVLSYLIVRFAQKREPVPISNVIPHFAIRRESTLLSDLTSPFGRARAISEDSLAPAQSAGDELCQGRVKLEIATPVDFVQILRLQRQLCEVPSLGLVSVGGSTAGNTAIVVVAEKPLPLISILQQIPSIKGVVNKKKNNIQVELETTEAS